LRGAAIHRNPPQNPTHKKKGNDGIHEKKKKITRERLKGKSIKKTSTSGTRDVEPDYL